jgi:hypothetical protein
MVAAGLQEKFSWKSVAASAVAAAVSNQISTSINTTSGVDADGNVIRTVSTFAENNPNLSRFAMGFVSGITGAYIRHGITNNEINFRDVAADSVGNTLADEIVGGLSTPTQTSSSIANNDTSIDPISGEHMRMATRNDTSSDDRIRQGMASMSNWGVNNSDVQELTSDDLDAISYSEAANAGDPMLVAGAGKLRGLRDGDRSYFGGLRLTQENVDAFCVNPSRVINADSFSGTELLGQSKESSQIFAGIGLSLLDSALEFGKMGLDFVNLANPQTYFDRAQGRSTTYSALGNALENGAGAGDIAGGIWNGIKTLPDRLAQAAENGNYVDFGREIGDGLQLAYGGAGAVTGTVALTRAGLSLAAKGVNALRTSGLGFKLSVENYVRQYLTPAEFAELPRTGTVDPIRIRFSQGEISPSFKPPYGSIDDFIDGLKSGAINPSSIKPVRIVEKDGQIYSLDNRRLHGFQEADIDIPFTKLDAIPKRQQFKFDTPNEGTSIIVRPKKN